MSPKDPHMIAIDRWETSTGATTTIGYAVENGKVVIVGEGNKFAEPLQKKDEEGIKNALEVVRARLTQTGWRLT